MSSPAPKSGQIHLARVASSSGTNEAGGTAYIQIDSFPQAFFMRSLGDAENLFVPLLDAACTAREMIHDFIEQGESRESAVALSGMQLASCLLADPNCSLSARGLPAESTYRINLDADTLHLSTLLFSVVNRRTSFFKVEMAGKVSEGPFVVRSPVQKTIIMQVDREQLRQPDFFPSALPVRCMRSQIDREGSTRVDETHDAGEIGEMRVVMTVRGTKIPVALQKVENGAGWSILDSSRHECLGLLSAEMEVHLGALSDFLRDMFAKR